MEEDKSKDQYQERDSQENTDCEKEKTEYLNGWRRAAAELENFKKKEAERLAQSNNYLRREIFKELLPLLDSLDRAIESQEGSKDGLEMVKNQFLKILENNGIRKIEAEPGDEFNHNIHSAISEVEVEEESLIGKIVSVASAGYELDDKVIRATKVIIGKQKES